MSRWWCEHCRRIADEFVCTTCGRRQTARARAFATTMWPHRTNSEAVLEGTLVEDRTPARNRAQPLSVREQALFAWMARQGAEYAALPRGMPWLDVVGSVMVSGSLATIAWLQLNWPGQAALALLLAPLAFLGIARQFAPQTWERWLQWYQVHRIPRTRRIVIASRDGTQPIGVEIDHPDSWNLPAGGGTVRCYGRWLESARLFRADRLVFVDDQWQRAIGPTTRSSGYQTFAFALGTAGLVLVVMALVEGIL